MATKLPPHANAEAHARFMARVKAMSSAQIAKTAETAGIYDAQGKLTPAFGGGPATGPTTKP